MSQTTDRTKSNFTNQREQREQVAVSLATERLPWHPAIGERFGIERSAWRALVEAVFPSAKTTEGVILALSYCKARKLDVFKRVVHIVPIWQKGEKGQKGHYVETVWPGIGETRATAFRTGNYAGCDDTKYGPDVERTWTVTSDDQSDNPQTRVVTLTFPEWAQVTVYRFHGEVRYAIPGPRAYWLETYAKESRWSDIPNEMWMRRPRGQIEKCADAGALRRAFPEELGDEPTADEMGYTGGPTIDPEGNRVDQGDAPPGADATQTSTQQNHPARASTASTHATSTGAAHNAGKPHVDSSARANSAPSQQPAASAAAQATQAAQTAPAQPAHDQETGEVQTATVSDGGFEAWVQDENEAETTVDLFYDAMQFAAELVRVCAGKDAETLNRIMDINKPYIEDCRDVSAPAAAIIDAIRARPANDKPPQATGQKNQEPANTEPAIEIITLETTPGGRPHWPNFATAFKKRLDQCRTAEEAKAVMAANKPTYFGKCDARQIHRFGRRYQVG
jgi:phage recombination protein Bet